MILFFFGALLYVIVGAFVIRLLREDTELGIDDMDTAMIATIFWPLVFLFWVMWRLLRALGWKK